jgi:hypothetical protein
MNRDLSVNHKCIHKLSKIKIDSILQTFNLDKISKLRIIKIQANHFNINSKKDKAVYQSPKYFLLLLDKTLIHCNSI